MQRNRIGSVEGKNVLLLQGPMGNFFKRLDDVLQKNGANTFRVGFNAGDSFFSHRDNYTPFRGKPEEYAAFIKEYMQKKEISLVFLFGDCRFYQSVTIQIAKEMGIAVYVFEEGYVRPNYITMELYGVNGFSAVPKEPSFYKSYESVKELSPQDVHPSHFAMVMSAITYYLVANLFSFRYPHYQHHRDFCAIKEGFYGVRNVVRKMIYKVQERGMEKRIEGELSRKYFFIPLQTHNDFQVLTHSPYDSIEAFIVEILASYAQSGREEKLLFKHHPVDRGRRNYARFIALHAKRLGIKEKVIVLHDTHLPTILKHAKGTVTINSTVGLSSLYHKTPVKVMGNAIYDIEGLTNKTCSLSEFWHSQQKVDKELFEKFRSFIIENTQLNGSFYGKMPVFDFEEDGV